MIAIIDYNAGNLTSVAHAVNFLGYRCQITANPQKILASQKIIFPGVGAGRKELRLPGADPSVEATGHDGQGIVGFRRRRL